MDDYMYHDYDGQDPDDEPAKKKRKKIISIIGTVFCLLWFVGIAVFLLVRHTENIRTDYPQITFQTLSATQEISPSENNEFVRLRMEIESKGKIIPNTAFFEKYPSFGEIFTVENAKKKGGCILHYDKDGYITVVEPYVDYQAKQDTTQSAFIGILGADVLMLPYSVSNGELVIGAPEKFCLRYDLSSADGVATVGKKEFVSESFRLNFYNISVLTQGAAKIDCRLGLCEYPTKWECDNRKIADCLTADGNLLELSDGNEPTQKHIGLTAKSSGKSLLKLNFDKRLYRKFDKFKIGVNTPEHAKYTIIINEGVK